MKLASVKILTDENISPKVVYYLRNKGFDVLDTKEQKWFGKDDAFLLAQSLSTKRFVLTHDSDFGTLIINEGKSFYGIIYLRLKSPKTPNVIDVLDRLFFLDIEVATKQILVISEEKIRIRKVD